MKKFLVFMLAVTMVVGAGAKEKKSKKDKKSKQTVEVVAPVTMFTNGTDSMSYALGVNVGTDLAKNLKTLPGGVYNMDLFLTAFTTALKGDSTLMTSEASQGFLQTYFTAAQERLSEEKKAEEAKFFAENAKNPAVQTTASGIQYIVLRDAEGLKPVATDNIKVDYEGTLLNGTKFDSSYDRGESIDFPLNQVIPGWTEGIQLMSVGSKYQFYIPYHLAYGEQGAGAAIPPYSALIFTIELLGINPPAITDQIKELEIK